MSCQYPAIQIRSRRNTVLMFIEIEIKIYPGISQHIELYAEDNKTHIRMGYVYRSNHKLELGIDKKDDHQISWILNKYESIV